MSSMKKKTVDKPFFISVLILMIAGFCIFCSASLGLLAQTNNTFKSVIINQIGFGLVLGSIAMYITSRINYRLWRKYALFVYGFSILLLIMLFVPHLGIKLKGARRWIGFGSFSFQPSEVYKVGFVIYFATWLSGIKSKVATFKYGTISFLAVSAISGALILSQPDTATFGVVFVAGLAMYMIAGARWRDLLILLAIGVISISALAVARPYVMDRIHTFIDPTSDPTGSGYQIQQSMIAIGSGGLFGRGFGQSVQKFNFLPEPIGDSVFAVAGEEFGFIGGTALILLYVAFTLLGFKIATRTPDQFGRLLVVGIVILITTGSMINIASMLGIVPVSGIPLLFISHGGTALFITLAEVGIILNVSRYQTA